jgi:ankyrin repeat protein
MLNAHGVRIPPLHLASSVGDVDAVKLLIDAGADIDALDYKNLTPIQIASDTRVIASLADAGAKVPWPDPPSWPAMDSFPCEFKGQLAEMIRCQGQHKWAANSNGLPGQWVEHQRVYEFIHPKMIRFLLENGVDLNLEDYAQRTLIHLALCRWASTIYLLSNPQILEFKPFPWHAIGLMINMLAWITTHWRFLRKRIPFEKCRRLMNLHPEQGRSPLCQAAAIDALRIIDRCLEMGADIDFEGSSHGSALSMYFLPFPSTLPLQLIIYRFRESAGIASTSSYISPI